MNGTFRSVEGWNAFSQAASVGLVAFTFIFGFIALKTGKILNARQSEKITKLEKAATDALAAQQTVELELSKSQQETAKVQNQVVDAQIQLEQLRRRTTPRVELFNMFAFRDSLKLHPGGHATVIIRSDNQEVLDFAKSLTHALTMSDWAIIPPDPNFAFIGFSNGICVRSKLGVTRTSTDTPAGLLEAALQHGGINVNGHAQQNDIPDDLVVIDIDDK